MPINCKFRTFSWYKNKNLIAKNCKRKVFIQLLMNWLLRLYGPQTRLRLSWSSTDYFDCMGLRNDWGSVGLQLSDTTEVQSCGPQTRLRFSWSSFSWFDTITCNALLRIMNYLHKRISTTNKKDTNWKINVSIVNFVLRKSYQKSI